MFETIEIQIEYLLFLQKFREITNGLFDDFFIASTWLGEIAIPIAILTFIYWGINKKIGTFMLMAFALNMYFNVFLKMTACINRPWFLDERIKPIPSVMPMADGYSFPSGHTAGAMGIWGSMAYCFWGNKVIRFISILFVCLVAISRNYVGVHTPQDVITSIIIGIIIIFCLTKTIKKIEKNNCYCNIALISLIIATILLCLYLQIKCNFDMNNYNNLIDVTCPLEMKHGTYGKIGFMFGIFSGLLIERNFIKFNTQNEFTAKKVLIILVGLALLYIIMTLLKNILIMFLATRFAYAITTFFTAIFITCIYPLIIKKLNY